MLSCPLPELDFDVITLGHGSGGILTNRLLEQTVFSLLGDSAPGNHDGALLEMNGRMAFTTDSFVVSPIFFRNANIGDLAVNGTINDLAVCGAKPKYLSLSFILEEGLRIKEFWDVLCSIKFCAEKAGVKIVTGDTKVVDKGKADKIFINTSGIGLVHPEADISSLNVSAGDKVICSDTIGNHGMAIMIERESMNFEGNISSDTRPIDKEVLSIVEKYGNKIKFLRDATRGGLATVLNELALESKKSVELIESDIPVHPEVVSLCEMLGLEPIYVANEGVFVMVLKEEIADQTFHFMKNDLGLKHAAIIGTISEQNPGKVILQNEIGGKRVVNMLAGEQLPRIC